jgi:hypothetical protein
MSTIYKAYANGKEITDFVLGGESANQIWGGNTLLWEKSGESLLKEICSVRIEYPWTYDTSVGYTRYYEIEFAVMNQSEDGTEHIEGNTKAGIYTKTTRSKIATNIYSYACYASILFTCNSTTDIIKNIRKTKKKYDYSTGELLEETVDWYYSVIYADGVYSYPVRDFPFDDGAQIAWAFFPITVSTSGSGDFSSVDELKQYFGVT